MTNYRQKAIDLRAEAVVEQHFYGDFGRQRKPDHMIDWARVDDLVRRAGEYDRKNVHAALND